MMAKGNQGAASVAEVNFGFRCKRSGRCCQVRGGVAWVDSGEQEALAMHMDLALEQFRARHTRELTDPRDGELRTALRDSADGACELLEQGNQCSVYEARPRQCRDFPFWDSVAGDAAAFERARTICPGIEAVPTGAFTQRVLPQLAELLHGVERVPNGACPHASGGATTVVSRLEFEALAQAAANSKPTEASLLKDAGAPKSCPSFRSDTCATPQAKPITCRELDESQRELLQEQLRALHKRTGYPHIADTIASFAFPDPAAALAPMEVPDADGLVARVTPGEGTQ